MVQGRGETGPDQPGLEEPPGRQPGGQPLLPQGGTRQEGAGRRSVLVRRHQPGGLCHQQERHAPSSR